MVNAFVLFFVCLWGLVDVKTVSVMEGDSVILNTDLSEVQKYLLIQWMFESTRIAEVDSLTQTNSTYDGPDERFRDRLKLDHQTGSLTITNTRTTDSGLYKVTVISKETSYTRFNLTVFEPPQSTSSPESSSSSNFLSSSSAVKFFTVNQTEDTNITELHQPCSDHFHCCGFIEPVIRLVVSALVGVAAVAFIVYDIRSTRSELNRMDETRYHRQIHGVKSDQQYKMSRSVSSRYVC
uniref:Immunoglobulin domain-containing protein n=3 Tax=Cyprinus carpio TaxID=7962 RepID=A0A9J8BVL7_CYPCA